MAPNPQNGGGKTEPNACNPIYGKIKHVPNHQPDNIFIEPKHGPVLGYKNRLSPILRNLGIVTLLTQSPTCSGLLHSTLSMQLHIYLSLDYLSIHPSVHPSTYLPTYLSISVYIYLSILYLPIRPSIHPSSYCILSALFSDSLPRND